MWIKVEERWAFYQQQHPSIVALDMAMNEVVRTDDGEVVLTKRFTADMRDIWSLQPRLEKRLLRQVPKLLEHPRFRAGYDFFLLRAQMGHLGEAGLDVANWWGMMYAANGAQRAQMLEELRNMPKAANAAGEGAPKKRRRRKPKSKSNAKNEANTVVDSNTENT
jgi:poly(A) polymerase